MFDFVCISGSEVGTHGTVVAGDYDATAACWERGILQVFGSEAGLSAGFLKGSGIFVFADGANVDD